MVAIQLGVILFLALLFILIVHDEYKKKKMSRKKAKTHRFWTNGISGGYERRRCVRIDTDIDVLYEVLYGNKAHKRSTLAKNISVGGLNLALEEKLLPDTLLELQLNIPGSAHSILTQGKIVWVKEIIGRFIVQKQERYFSTGVKFLEMSQNDQALLNSFIDHHTKK
ncbi:MAG: PilZ domain-containing protein [Candidatus Omnitrophota bacterium]